MSSRYEGRRAVIYTRVSKDRAGGRSVAEQEAECRLVCRREGWEVAEILSDNDVGASRWSKGDRPSYERLSRILRAGDVLVTWEASRAQRDLAAYSELRQLCTDRDVLWCYSGRVFDLSRSDDRFMTLLDIGLAEKEVDQTRERIMRTLRANIEAGKPHGVRAFGYRIVRDPDTGKSIGRELDPVEAPIVREIVDRFLGGEPMRRIAIDLNERGILTTRKGQWSGMTVGKLLYKPTYAGLRSHNGVITGPGNWPAIITEDEWRRCEAILSDPKRKLQRGTAPKSLLSGIAVCGSCNLSVYRAKHHGRIVYSCRGNGCVTRRTDDVDARVEEWMFKLLADPRVIERLQSYDGEDGRVIREAQQKIDGIRQRMDEFAVSAAKGDISARAYAMMEKEWMIEIVELEQITRRSPVHPKLHELTGGYARETWESMSLDDQRAILRSTITVTLNSVRNLPDRDPVVIDWKR